MLKSSIANAPPGDSRWLVRVIFQDAQSLKSFADTKRIQANLPAPLQLPVAGIVVAMAIWQDKDYCPSNSLNFAKWLQSFHVICIIVGLLRIRYSFSCSLNAIISWFELIGTVQRDVDVKCCQGFLSLFLRPLPLQGSLSIVKFVKVFLRVE